MKEKFGVAPSAGRRRARADGRLDRQHQGRAGHRREGRARSDRHVRRRSRTLLAHAGEVSNKRYREGLLEPRRTTRGRAASWRGSGSTCPVRVRSRGAALSRRRPAACFELFTRLGFRSLVMEFAPTAETDRQGLRGRDATRTALRALVDGAACGRTLRAPRPARRARGDARRASPASRSRPRRSDARYVAVHRAAVQRAADCSARGDGRRAAGVDAATSAGDAAAAARGPGACGRSVTT